MVKNKNKLNKDPSVCSASLMKNIKKSEYIAHEDFRCDICHSQDIGETCEGYVCRNCGLVLEVPKLEYHAPYNNEIVQYAKLGTTQIGSIRERFQNDKSVQLVKLNKLHAIRSNKEATLEQAKIEINRIITCLRLPQSLKGLIFKKFKMLWASLRPGTKYRSPEKLIPITIYFICKIENISINESELLEVSKISKKDFNHFKLQIFEFFPQYQERNRKKYILQKLLEISEHFKLGMDFFQQAKLILYELWDTIKNTKDDVIAGLSCSIALLCAFDTSQVSVSSICTRLGIKMSTIQFQVKNKIFDSFKISGFTSLIQSKDLLRKVIKKMGLLRYGSAFPSEKVPTSDIVKVELGVGVPIRSHNSVQLYISSQKNDGAVINSVKSYSKRNFSGMSPDLIITSHEKNSFVDLELLKYKMGKGPPPDKQFYCCYYIMAFFFIPTGP